MSITLPLILSLPHSLALAPPFFFTKLQYHTSSILCCDKLLHRILSDHNHQNDPHCVCRSILPDFLWIIQQKLILCRKPRNARSKRALEAREPKLVENPKNTLFLSGTSTSDLTRSAMTDIVRSPHPSLFPRNTNYGSHPPSTPSKNPTQ